jgi:hypothetical protein
MQRTQKKSKADWLVGRWHVSGEQIAVIFTIGRTTKGFRIQAIDESDGEELVVSKVAWDGKVLSFETRTPSNEWRTRNRLKPISKSKAIHELTHWEPWEKLPAETSQRTAESAPHG